MFVILIFGFRLRVQALPLWLNAFDLSRLRGVIYDSLGSRSPALPMDESE